MKIAEWNQQYITKKISHQKVGFVLRMQNLLKMCELYYNSKPSHTKQFKFERMALLFLYLVKKCTAHIIVNGQRLDTTPVSSQTTQEYLLFCRF